MPQETLQEQYVEHPRIVEGSLEARTYQEVIAAEALEQNTIVVLPTGLGKTAVGILVAAERLEQSPSSKVLMLAPTKPLAEQHRDEFERCLEVDTDVFEVLTGETRPEKREEVWKEVGAFFGTPQTVENDIINGRVDLSDFSLVIFDEVHRATGDYPYKFIADKYTDEAEDARILGLTASPGGEREKIERVADNLYVDNFETRTEEDPDVEPYVEEKETNWVKVQLDRNFERVKKQLEQAERKRLSKLKGLGLLDSTSNVQKSDLLKLRGEIGSRLGEEDDPELYQGMSHVAACMKIEHALELLETQGTKPLYQFLEKMEKDPGSKAAKTLLEDENFRNAMSVTEWMVNNGKEHPKLEKLESLLEEKIEREKNAIVFTQYRDTVDLIHEKLEGKSGIEPVRFKGQKEDFTQKRQMEILDEFRDGDHNVLVSTSLHPKETIVVKSPDGAIKVVRIGTFVDQFLESQGADSERVEEEWEVFTTDGNETFFKPVTDVHRHKRENRVIESTLKSCGDFLVTENHSVFSFGSDGEHIPETPEEGRLVNMAWDAPNEETVEEIDLAEVLWEELPEEEKEDFYFIFDGLDQPKMRELKSERQFLDGLQKTDWRERLAHESRLDPSTVSNVAKRLEERGIIKRHPQGRKIHFHLTEKGERYREFLNWFDAEEQYYKRKYRVGLGA
ncbi:MAG: DEAD/DEAH box helicase family protein, partial [Candidatus Nanohaloarchaea archaeon]|nr:DEAD/DEAH box helicase family protein [Candidatus Nanohaloarchaea archaeon]